MSDVTEYTYLTLPADEGLRSCIGLVVAGMAARARIGVGGLEEAVGLLEDHHASKGPTRYRFSFSGDGIIAEVEESSAARVPGPAVGDAGWRTVVELVA